MQEVPVLKPLSVGDIIDRTLRLLRANAVLFFSIAIIPALVVEVLQRAVGLSQTLDMNDFSAAFGRTGTVPRTFQVPNPAASGAVVLVSVLLSVIEAAALIVAVGQRYLGRPVTFREAYERGLRAVPVLVLSGLVIGVAFVVVIGLVAVGFAVLSASTAAVVGIGLLGIVGFLFILPWAFLSLAVTGPAIVLEGNGPIAAIRRSFHLMDRARLRTLGLYFLMGIISSILALIFGVVFFVSFVTDSTIRSVLQTVASVATSAISGPLIYGALVILYYDLRVRKEAFDLQLAAEALPREA